MTFNPETNKVYLGDSVYAQMERGMLKLTTENGSGPSNTIYFDPNVYYAFLEYAQKVVEFYSKKREQEYTGEKKNTLG